ncbi:MAG: disulfide bond formation protein B [Ahrensia sp.]|nr:disulfide bond formation protein B [Ahrensia sp.]
MTALNSQNTIAWIVALGMIAVIGAALAFEHIGGYAPCELCLRQRTPYYVGIPIILAGALLASFNTSLRLVQLALIGAVLSLLATAGLGIYHAGAEWSFWPGPASCGAGTTATSSDASTLLDSLSNATPPSCTDAAGRFLGLSFAGWNVIAALGLALIAARGLFLRPVQTGRAT